MGTIVGIIIGLGLLAMGAKRYIENYKNARANGIADNDISGSVEAIIMFGFGGLIFIDNVGSLIGNEGLMFIGPFGIAYAWVLMRNHFYDKLGEGKILWKHKRNIPVYLMALVGLVTPPLVYSPDEIMTEVTTFAEWHDATDEYRLTLASAFTYPLMGSPSEISIQLLTAKGAEIVSCLNQIDRNSQIKPEAAASTCYKSIWPEGN